MYIKTKPKSKPTDDPKKPTKIKVTKPTSAEVEAATRFAKEMAIKRGLISGENTHTGGLIPKFVDEAGRELMPGDVSPEVGRLDSKVPSYVKELEWDAKANLPYYMDEKTGDLKYVAKDLFHLPRFRKAVPLSSMTNSIAKR